MIKRIKSLLYLFSRKENFGYVDGGEYGINKSKIGFIIFYNNEYLVYEEKDSAWLKGLTYIENKE